MVRQLVAAGHDVYVVTAAPEFGVTTEIGSSRLHIRNVPQFVLDCVAVETDRLTVDRSASMDKVFSVPFVRITRASPSSDDSCAGGVQVPRASILKSEAEWLEAIDANILVLIIIL